MGRGFLSGLISGTFVGAIILALLSLFAPLPDEAQPVITDPATKDVASDETAEQPKEEVAAQEEPNGEAAADDNATTDASEDTSEPAPQTAETDEAASKPDAEADFEADVNTTEPDSSQEESSLNETATEDDATTASGEGEEEELAARLARMLADAPVDVEDAAPQSPDSPEAVLRDTLAALAPDAASDATGAPQVAENFSDVSIFNTPRSNTDVASVDTTEPAFELPEVLEFDPEPPEFNEAVVAPKLEVAIAPGASTSSASQTIEPATQSEPSPEIASQTAQPQSDASEGAPTEESAEPENDLVAEANALLGNDDVITRRLPQTTDALPDATQPSGLTEEEVPALDVVRNRLPSLGEEVGAAPQEEAAATDEAPLNPDAVGALRAFAAPSPEASDLPRVSVILISAGDLGIATSELLSLKLPVSVAVSTSMPGGQRAFQNYRTGGIEVLAMVDDLPARAAPADVQVALEGYFQQFDEVIGILEPTDRRMQINRGLLEPVLDGLKSGGHALVTYEQGLRSAQQAAEGLDVPAASIFRVLDEELEGTPKIMRYLDRAGFAANQKGQVIVLGHSYRETVDAITDWASENQENFQFVPVSDILLSN